MAEIQTYPTGTPTGTDQVPYIADPAGTPALKLADVSALTGGGGGGGLTWTLVVDEDGSSIANWSVASGTWASTSGRIVCSAEGMLLWNTPMDLTMAVFEAEVQFVAGGGDRYGGIIVTARSATNYTHAQFARLQRVSGTWNWEAERGAIVAIGNGVLTGGAEDTWFKLRMVMVGPRVGYYVDGTFVLGFDVAHDWPINTVGFAVPVNTSPPVWFRNIKVWTADLGLPA